MSPPILDPIRGALLRTQPDARLVALAREGRERAFEEIVRRYRAPLVAFAAMFVPAHRADDVVQESLLRAFDALRSSDAEIQLRPWLFRIVRNQALNDLRDTPAHDELTEELDGVASPQEVAERREEVAAIVGGLQALPEAQREAIVARELEGRGHAEIAAELGTSTGAVRQLIFRARTTLRGAAGLLIPLPLLRLLLGPGGAEAAGAATGAGVAAATAGGGVAGKVAVGLAGVAVAVGGGVAAERNRDDAGDRIASASEAEEDGGSSGISGSGGSGHPGGSAGSGGPGGGPSGSSGPGPGDDDSGHGSGDRSGHGSGEREGGDDSSGPGSSGSGHDGSSGPGSSGSDSSGSGSGDDFAEIDDDSGSSGSSGSGSSGSGSSGSDSSDSGVSGSGTSGSGSSGSDSSGSGSSGAGISGSGTSGSGSSGSGSSGGGGDPDELDDELD